MRDEDVRRAKPTDGEVLFVTLVWMVVGFLAGALVAWCFLTG